MRFFQWLGLIAVFALTIYLTMYVWQLPGGLCGVLTLVTTSAYMLWLVNRDES